MPGEAKRKRSETKGLEMVAEIIIFWLVSDVNELAEV